MKYMGSKRRIWKYIAPIILENRKEGQCYVEPFCGGCNSLSMVNGWRLAADINPCLIAMFRSLLKDEPQYFPIDEKLYRRVKESYKNRDNKYSFADLGWIGFNASYNGTFFHGYNGNNPKRDYASEGVKNILNQLDSLRGVEFHCCSYDKLIIPKKSIIYCDIPYRGTEKYDKINFDYDKFYQWCFDKKEEGHSIFISEYNMPKEFKCIWQMKVSNSLDRYSEQKALRTEKLFTL